MSDPHVGTVRDGFGTRARGSNRFQSQSFRADKLRDVVVDVKSLRTLQDRFDGTGCDQWPFCIGERWDRGGALRVRLRRDNNNKIVYESALYWHMQPEEWSAYQAKEDAWRAAIESGSALFGTRLEMGKDADIRFAIRPVLDLVERLSFDGNEVIHVGTETTHSTLTENISLATTGSGKIQICHKPGTSGTNRKVDPEDLMDHLRHGDHLLKCN